MNFFQTILRSIVFDKSVYNEAKLNSAYNSYAVLIIVLASICTGVGTHNLTDDSSIFRGLIFSLIGWLIWTTIIYLIGNKLFNITSDFSNLSRCLALAYSPSILNIFGIINVALVPIFTLTALWTVTSFIYGVKQAYETTVFRAFAISIIGLVPYSILRLIFLFF